MRRQDCSPARAASSYMYYRHLPPHYTTHNGPTAVCGRTFVLCAHYSNNSNCSSLLTSPAPPSSHSSTIVGSKKFHTMASSSCKPSMRKAAQQTAPAGGALAHAGYQHHQEISLFDMLVLSSPHRVGAPISTTNTDCASSRAQHDHDRLDTSGSRTHHQADTGGARRTPPVLSKILAILKAASQIIDDDDIALEDEDER